MPDESFRILIVDDDPAFLRFLKKLLDNAGHDVLTAQDGVQAMRLLLDEGPQMVITDGTMPGLDGIELCRAIRSNEALGFVYIVLVTAHTAKQYMLRAFEAGADDFLLKPIDRAELLARLRAARRLIKLQSDLDKQNREVHLANARMAMAASQLEEANRKLQILATTDELTGLLNRRETMNRLEQHWSRALRHHEPLSCILIDIDHFKRVNDTYGHAAGDMILKKIAEALRSLARAYEDVCRIGGEEFLVLCPKASLHEANEAAQRFCIFVGATKVPFNDTSISATISVGVAEKGPAMRSPENLLRCADEAMYAAKAAGRNTVRTYREPPVTA